MAQAQYIKLDRHPEILTQYELAFVDYVKGNVASLFKSTYGQYFGQVNQQGEVYGYGTFYTDRDGEIYGQFRNGNFICGIKMNASAAKVGTEEHYSVYDLTTGELSYIVRNDNKFPPDADHKANWRFVQMVYENGDKYVGETVAGKRDGYGIYYYADGNYYVGRYADNHPVGYGALFRTDNRVVLQGWE